MKHVLVTGFGPYLEESDNPSGAIAEYLDGQVADGVTFSGCVLPVSSARAPMLLRAAIAATSPDVVVLTGVTPSRTRIALERVAVNIADFPIPDVEGVIEIDAPIEPGGPAAYLSTLPVKTILSGWQAIGIDGYVSNSAGTYLCNQLFYVAQHLTAGSATCSGLVHVPLPGHGADGRPSFDAMADAVQLAGATAATHVGPDLVMAAGSTS